MTSSFIGAGWAHPARIDATGSVALVTRDREIAEAIEIILMTSPGERAMRPEFGCRVQDFVFGPVTTSTAGQIAHEVRAALDRWEPRIEVSDVLIGFDNETEGTVYIDVRYEIRGTNDERNLVFPFYVIPDDVPGSTAPVAALASGGR
jgi:phage baseplate assembly protein W